MSIFASKIIQSEMNTLRKISIAAAVLLAGLNAQAQENPDTSYWSHSGKAGLTFSQVGFSNWASGGEPSVSWMRDTEHSGSGIQGSLSRRQTIMLY
jgi:hypothetical protein